MEAKRYEFAVNIVDTQILKKDELIFSVLETIVNNKSRLVITDHKRFVICHSCSPYPVWIWASDDMTENEVEDIWQLIKTEFPFEEGYSFNTKYFIAEYFIKRGREEKQNLGISMNLCIYDCENPIPPEKKPEGTIRKAFSQELMDVSAFIWSFKQETGVDIIPKAECLKKAEALIDGEYAYLWKNTKGENVAMCSFNYDNKLGKITHVYTKPEERRKGYAENLVYEVTKIIKDKGLLPVLYTDADYVASNECYKKVGYALKGRLCTVAKI